MRKNIIHLADRNIEQMSVNKNTIEFTFENLKDAKAFFESLTQDTAELHEGEEEDWRPFVIVDLAEMISDA